MRRRSNTWTTYDPRWRALGDHERVAAMALMEADRGRDYLGNATNVMHAIHNRAAAERAALGQHVSGRIYQPTVEPAQQRRLNSILRSPEYQQILKLSQSRAAGEVPDAVGGATHFLAHEPVMEALRARNPGKYRSWVNWTGYNQGGGKYQNVTHRDASHAFLTPVSGRPNRPSQPQVAAIDEGRMRLGGPNPTHVIPSQVFGSDVQGRAPVGGTQMAGMGQLPVVAMMDQSRPPPLPPPPTPPSLPGRSYPPYPSGKYGSEPNLGDVLPTYSAPARSPPPSQMPSIPADNSLFGGDSPSPQHPSGMYGSEPNLDVPIPVYGGQPPAPAPVPEPPKGFGSALAEIYNAPDKGGKSPFDTFGEGVGKAISGGGAGGGQDTARTLAQLGAGNAQALTQSMQTQRRGAEETAKRISEMMKRRRVGRPPPFEVDNV